MAFEAIPGGGTIVTGEQDTRLVQLMTLRSGLELEIKTGMQLTRTSSASAAIKRMFPEIKSRTKKGILKEFNVIVAQKKLESLEANAAEKAAAEAKPAE